MGRKAWIAAVLVAAMVLGMFWLTRPAPDEHYQQPPVSTTYHTTPSAREAGIRPAIGSAPAGNPPAQASHDGQITDTPEDTFDHLDTAERLALEDLRVQSFVDRRVLDEYRSNDRVRAQVLFNVPGLDGRFGGPEFLRDDVAATIDSIAAEFLAAMPGDAYELAHQTSHVPMIAGMFEPSALLSAAGHPQIAEIILDEPVTVQLRQALPLVNQGFPLEGTALPQTGNGVTVAIVDSGIDGDHPLLQDSITRAVCTCGASCCTPGDDGTEDDPTRPHGTWVAGVITANQTGNGTIAGIASGANVLPVKVEHTGGGFASDSVRGFNWLVDNASDVKIINYSINFPSLGAFNSICDDRIRSLNGVFETLAARGVSIFVSSGNDSRKNGIAVPACYSSAISVGSVFDSGGNQDKVDPTSNSGDILDVLAPGNVITTTNNGGGLVSVAGTSFASPMAAGCAALMLEKDGSLRSEEVRVLLRRSPTAITDTNGITIPRLDCANALSRVDAALADSDFDLDGIRDGYDNCPELANLDQNDTDGNGVGDECDIGPDEDFDGVPDDVDNCVLVPNPRQEDADDDGAGDVCDEATELFNGGPTGTLAFPSDDDLIGSPRAQVAADDFTAPAGVLTGLRWYGMNWPDDVLPAQDDFTIQIYADDDGRPGSLVYDVPTSDVVRADSGMRGLSRDLRIFSYDAEMPSLSLDAGTYWLAIRNNTASLPDGEWLWAVANETGNARASVLPNLRWVAVDVELVFLVTMQPSTAPRDTDVDSDGLTNEFEAANGLNALSTDSDGDGVLDGADDLDGDGVTNAGEQVAGTNARSADTDGDGLADGTELAGVAFGPARTIFSTPSDFSGMQIAVGKFDRDSYNDVAATYRSGGAVTTAWFADPGLVLMNVEADFDAGDGTGTLSGSLKIDPLAPLDQSGNEVAIGTSSGDFTGEGAATLTGRVYDSAADWPGGGEFDLAFFRELNLADDSLLGDRVAVIELETFEVPPGSATGPLLATEWVCTSATCDEEGSPIRSGPGEYAIDWRRDARTAATRSGGNKIVQTGDIDQDGDEDMLVVFSDELRWYGNIFGASQFSFTTIDTNVQPYITAVLADVNFDDRLDVVAVVDVDNPAGAEIEWRIEVHLNAGAGAFTGPFTVTNSTGYFVNSLDVVDVNGDDFADIVVGLGEDPISQETAYGVYISLANPTAGASGWNAIIESSRGKLATPVDIDLDGDLDLVTAHGEGADVGTIAWHENVSGFDALEDAQVLVATGPTRPRSLMATDMNGDGVPELLGTNSTVGSFLVSRQNGGWSWNQVNATPNSLVSRSATQSISVDLDANGTLDVLEQEQFLGFDLVRWYPRVSLNATEFDTDGDELGDGFEQQFGFDPLDRDEDDNGTADGLQDGDNDGLSNAEEQDLGTNPTLADTDGDSVSDGDENDAGSDPVDADSIPRSSLLPRLLPLLQERAGAQ